MMTGNGPQVMFLCYAMDDDRIQEICRRNSYAPMQTQRFTWRLIRGVEGASGRPVHLAAFAPVADYPGYPDILIRRRAWPRDEGDSAEELGFVNLIGLKHITRFVSALRALRAWARQNAAGSAIVVNYGAASSQLFACLVARTFTTLRIVNVVTDPPGLPHGKEGMVLRMLRRVDVAMTRFALARMDGVIVLTVDLERAFAPGRPALVVEGIVDACGPQRTDAPNPSVVSESDLFIVTYAGGLAAESGVDNLLDAFGTLKHPDMRLWIFGKGALADLISERASKDSRIIYFGFVSDEDLEERLRVSSVLVVPRPVAEPMSPYVFPPSCWSTSSPELRWRRRALRAFPTTTSSTSSRWAMVRSPTWWPVWRTRVAPPNESGDRKQRPRDGSSARHGISRRRAGASGSSSRTWRVRIAAKERNRQFPPSDPAMSRMVSPKMMSFS